MHGVTGDVKTLYALSAPKVLTIDSLYQFFQLIHFCLYAQLRKYIIVLNTVKEFRQAPKRVGFDDIQLIFRQRVQFECVQLNNCKCMRKEGKRRRNENTMDGKMGRETEGAP